MTGKKEAPQITSCCFPDSRAVLCNMEKIQIQSSKRQWTRADPRIPESMQIGNYGVLVQNLSPGTKPHVCWPQTLSPRGVSQAEQARCSELLRLWNADKKLPNRKSINEHTECTRGTPTIPEIEPWHVSLLQRCAMILHMSARCLCRAFVPRL